MNNPFDAYKGAQQRAVVFLKEIQRKIEARTKKSRDDINWSHVDSLGFVNSLLKEIDTFLAD